MTCNVKRLQPHVLLTELAEKMLAPSSLWRQRYSPSGVIFISGIFSQPDVEDIKMTRDSGLVPMGKHLVYKDICLTCITACGSFRVQAFFFFLFLPEPRYSLPGSTFKIKKAFCKPCYRSWMHSLLSWCAFVLHVFIQRIHFKGWFQYFYKQ